MRDPTGSIISLSDFGFAAHGRSHFEGVEAEAVGGGTEAALEGEEVVRCAERAALEGEGGGNPDRSTQRRNGRISPLRRDRAGKLRGAGAARADLVNEPGETLNSSFFLRMKRCATCRGNCARTRSAQTKMKLPGGPEMFESTGAMLAMTLAIWTVRITRRRLPRCCRQSWSQ